MLQMAAKAGFFKPGLHTGQRRSPRQHIRDGICLAALRAFTGAELYRAKPEKLTLGEVALRVGSGIHYVRAAVVLIEHGDQVLIDRVLRGKCSILAAAASVNALVKLLGAFKTASPENLAKFYTITGTADLSTPVRRMEAAAKFGPEVVWDEMVMPLISNGR
jgi:hypothetical protein